MSSQTAEIIDDEKYLPETPWICNITVLIAVDSFDYLLNTVSSIGLVG